jgi:hypothetical protein
VSPTIRTEDINLRLPVTRYPEDLGMEKSSLGHGLRVHEAFFRESYEPPMLSVIPLARATQFAKKMGAKVIAVSRQNWVKEFGERNSWIKILFPDRNFIST